MSASADRPNDRMDSLIRLGDARIDAILQGVTALFEVVFPTRVRGYYLLGSFSEHTSVALSDIDLIILFAGGFEGNEEATAQRVVEACGLLSPIRLDIALQSEETLRIEDVRLKLGSLLITGEDVRAQIPLPTPEAHARYMTDWALWFIRRLHDGASLGVPLNYPDSTDAFYGYARVRIPGWYPTGTVQGTKEFVATVCWTATALLSLILGADGYVGTKGEAVRRYRDLGDGEWGSYVTEVYSLGKGEWRYGVPESVTDRQHLGKLCAQGLPFFNHYLTRYRDYLNQQRRGEDATERQWAEEQLRQLA